MNKKLRKKKGEALVARNQEEVKKRAEKIEGILKVLGKAKFQHVTELSQHVAKRLSEIEGKPCSDSCIRRNDVYRAMLDEYMDKIEGKKKKDEGSLVLSLQLKIRNLQKERDAFEKQLSISFEKIAELESLLQGYSVEITDQKKEKMNNPINEKYHFILNSVLSLVGSIKIDLSKGEVIDEMHMRPVFTRKELPEFFEWYERYSV